MQARESDRRDVYARVVRKERSRDALLAAMEASAAGQWCGHMAAGDQTDMEAEPCGQRGIGEQMCQHGRTHGSRLWTEVPHYNEMIERMFSLWSVGESFKMVRWPRVARVALLPPCLYLPARPPRPQPRVLPPQPRAPPPQPRAPPPQPRVLPPQPRALPLLHTRQRAPQAAMAGR